MFERYKDTLTDCQREIFDKIVSILMQEDTEIDINPWFVIAIIEAESNFDDLAIDKEKSHFGLMQISLFYHYDRMIRLGGHDIFNAVDNTRTGIDILKELRDTVVKKKII